MKLNSIINRHVLKEMLAPFSINVLVFTFLFLMTELIKITNWIVNYNLSVFSVLTLFFFSHALVFNVHHPHVGHAGGGVDFFKDVGRQ